MQMHATAVARASLGFVSPGKFLLLIRYALRIRNKKCDFKMRTEILRVEVDAKTWRWLSGREAMAEWS